MMLKILLPFLLSSLLLKSEAFRLCDIMDTFIKPNNLCTCSLLDASYNGLDEIIARADNTTGKMFLTDNW